MQIEVKVGLDFLLSFLYDKLPRRRVNLFGEELEKYLKLKFFIKNTADLNKETNCLNINFKSFNSTEIIDPCLIAAAKDSAVDILEILQYLPSRLKLFIEPGLVYYAVLANNISDDIEEIKIIYNEKINDSNTYLQQQSQLQENVHLETKYLQPTLEFLPDELNSLSIKDDKIASSKDKQLFTTAAFAQTKFGTTKRKSSNFLNNNPRSVKQQNQKKFSNEFAAYIKSKSELQNVTSQKSYQPIVEKHGFNEKLLSDLFSTNDTNQMTNKLEFLLKQQKQNSSPVVSPISSSSSVTSSLDFLTSSSTFEDLEENLINNYFNPSALSTFSLPMSLLNYQHNQTINIADLKDSIDRQTNNE